MSDISWRRPRAPPCWSACEGRMSSESGVAAARLPSPPTGMTALRCSLGLLLLLLPLSVAPARLPTAPPTGRNCSCTKATAPCSDWLKNFERDSSPASECEDLLSPSVPLTCSGFGQKRKFCGKGFHCVTNQDERECLAARSSLRSPS